MTKENETVAKQRYVLGVDIGGTSIKTGLFDDNGKLLEKWEMPTDKSCGGKYILSSIAKDIDEKMEQRAINKSDIIGIGAGVPGPVEKGIVYKCVNLGWDVYPAAEILSSLTKLEVRLSNDARAAALGEMFAGAGREFESFIFVTIGTGIGAGIIVDKKLVLGAHGSCGEIGHMTVNPQESESCNCGKKGCLEQYSSATAMVRLAKRLISEGGLETMLESDEEITAKKITDMAAKGDSLALEVVETMGKNLGLALSNAVCACDPQVIIIGGGVSKAGEVILKPIEKYYREFVFHKMQSTPIKIAFLGNDAGIYGGASLFFK